MDEYDDNDMRASMLNEDAQRDRRLIMKKMQQRQRSIRQSQKDAAKAERRNSIQSGDGSNSIIEDDDNDSVNEELLYEIQAAHEAHAEDEELIGYGDEGIDAIQASLTSPPSTWWAMRKQWQKRKGNVMDKIGALKGNSDEHLPDNYNMDGGGGGEDGIDASYRSTNSGHMRSRLGIASGDAGVVGHPIMLEDPTSIGYDSSAFRSNPYALGPNQKKKGMRAPSVMYVSRETLQKRKLAQISYLIGAICIIFLFMFILEQRKISHYAMVNSPMSLSAYLAGEELMAERDENDVSLKDLGLDNGVPQVEFGSIEVNPNDPLANEDLASDPVVGNFPEKTPMFDKVRFEKLKGVLIGLTPPDVFEILGSPQFKALHWLANEDVLQYNPDTDQAVKKIIQRYALTTLYFATNGEQWTDGLNFLSQNDECDWNDEEAGGSLFKGVGHCNEEGDITSLALWSNNLDGGKWMWLTVSMLRT